MMRKAQRLKKLGRKIPNGKKSAIGTALRGTRKGWCDPRKSRDRAKEARWYSIPGAKKNSAKHKKEAFG